MLSHPPVPPPVVARPGLPPPPSKTPRTVAVLGMGILAAWMAPALAIGLVTAASALTPSAIEEPPEPTEPTEQLTWEQIDLAEDRELPAPALVRPRPTPSATPAEPPEPETGALTLHLAPGLFATTATAQCPDGSRHRATFENGVARFDAIPGSEVCRITFQGGLVTSLRSGPGELHCLLAATAGAVVCS